METPPQIGFDPESRKRSRRWRVAIVGAALLLPILPFAAIDGWGFFLTMAAVTIALLVVLGAIGPGLTRAVAPWMGIDPLNRSGR